MKRHIKSFVSLKMYHFLSTPLHTSDTHYSCNLIAIWQTDIGVATYTH